MATYKHDALGRRVEKDLGTSRERYVYSGFETVSVYDSSDTWVRDFVFGQGIDEPLMLRQADVTDFDGDQDTSEVTRHYYHRNALDSVLLLTDMNEAEGVSYRYDPYGAVTISVGGTPQSDDPLGNPWMFTARFQDEETGLMYYRARQYAPGVGRFLQRDPLGYADGPGLYVYAMLNPMRWRDPLGESAWGDWEEWRDRRLAEQKVHGLHRFIYSAVLDCAARSVLPKECFCKCIFKVSFPGSGLPVQEVVYSPPHRNPKAACICGDHAVCRRMCDEAKLPDLEQKLAKAQYAAARAGSSLTMKIARPKDYSSRVDLPPPWREGEDAENPDYDLVNFTAPPGIPPVIETDARCEYQ